MVFGLIGIAAGAIAIPLSATSTSTSVIGIVQGTQAQQNGGGGGDAHPSEADKKDPRLAKFTIVTEADEDVCHDRIIVLRNNKLYLDKRDPSCRQFVDGHAFSGFYLEYLWDKKPLALVSTIKSDPPELNWIYVDRNTHQVKYGNKSASMPHIPGPWDWTEDQVGVTVNGWEPFVALEEKPGHWVLYCDLHEDYLRRVDRGDRRVAEVSLNRELLPPT